MFATPVDETPFLGTVGSPWADDDPLHAVSPDAPRLSELSASGFAAIELDCATADAAAMSDDAVLDGIVGLDKVVSWAQARQARLLAEFATRRGDTPEAFNEDTPSTISPYAPDELGVALRLSRGEAMYRLNQASFLVGRTPAVVDAWENGALDGSKVRTITDAVAFVQHNLAVAVIDRVLPAAPQQSKGQLRAALAKAIIAVDPDGANQRHRRARTDRRVTVSEQPEGMASLWAYLTAPDARSCWEWLTRLARGLGKDDPRPMDARRADLLAALLSGRITLTDAADAADPADVEDAEDADDAEEASAAGAGAGAESEPESEPESKPAADDDAAGRSEAGADDIVGGPPGLRRPPRERIVPVTPGKPLVTIVIPHTTLIGTDEQPVELAGYGHIPADLAREIAADAVWRRLLADPASGTVLDHGRTTYHPPAGLADWVRARDLTCRGPRCRRPASGCELDHHVPYPTGPTAEPNLHALCKIHHDLKGRGGWQVLAHDDGSLEWISPCGYGTVTHPRDYKPDPADHDLPDPADHDLPDPAPDPAPDPPTPTPPPDDDEPPF